MKLNIKAPPGLIVLSGFQILLVLLNLFAIFSLFIPEVKQIDGQFPVDVLIMLSVKTTMLMAITLGFLGLQKWSYWLALLFCPFIILTGDIGPFFGFGTVYAMILLLVLVFKYRKAFQ